MALLALAAFALAFIETHASAAIRPGLSKDVIPRAGAIVPINLPAILVAPAHDRWGCSAAGVSPASERVNATVTLHRLTGDGHIAEAVPMRSRLIQHRWGAPWVQSVMVVGALDILLQPASTYVVQVHSSYAVLRNVQPAVWKDRRRVSDDVIICVWEHTDWNSTFHTWEQSSGAPMPGHDEGLGALVAGDMVYSSDENSGSTASMRFDLKVTSPSLVPWVECCLVRTGIVDSLTVGDVWRQLPAANSVDVRSACTGPRYRATDTGDPFPYRTGLHTAQICGHMVHGFVGERSGAALRASDSDMAPRVTQHCTAAQRRLFTPCGLTDLKLTGVWL